MPVQTLTSRSEFQTLIASHPHVVLQATASWCGPCKAITPIYNKHADTYGIPDKYAFARFDTDDVPDLAVELGIRTVPAFFFFENEEKAETVAGANPPALQKAIEAAAEKAKSAEAAPLKTDENF
ncbi:thioredoxin domain-containing protein [Sarocladium implicatum]|nr:thioredoxin domain-containing protein [Sarocladium implicatum]